MVEWQGTIEKTDPILFGKWKGFTSHRIKSLNKVDFFDKFKKELGTIFARADLFENGDKVRINVEKVEEDLKDERQR